MNISRKKRPLERNIECLRDAKIIIIATEGSDTEKIYFSKFRDSRVQVHVVPSKNGLSAPKWILANAQAYKDQYQIGEGDEIWLAIDRDRWDPGQLSQIAADCVAQDINLAVSVPRFEIWLSLHFPDPLPNPMNKGSLEAHLKRLMSGYSKSRYDCTSIMPMVGDATARARAMDTNPTHRWPTSSGTRVYRIIESMLASCYNQNKILGIDV